MINNSAGACRLKEWGFEKGWGDRAERVKETMRMVSEIIEATDPQKMESFFSRIPVIFNVVIFSIHGYFGQSNVLGLPDTGGQVSYFYIYIYIYMPFKFSHILLLFLQVFI